MQTGIMITDGGPHPADKWAAQSAAHIVSMIQVDQNSISPEARAARRVLPRFEMDLADALEPHHLEFAEREREHLARDAARLNDAHVRHDELDGQVAVVMEMAARTPFAAHFAAPNTAHVVRAILQSHFASVQHVERGWHADGRPTDCEHAAIFRLRHKSHAGAAPHVVAE